MKKSYYFGIAISISLSALLLTGCGQNAVDKASPAQTAAVSDPIPNEIDANYTEKLKTEAYGKEEIEASQAYVSRVILQLSEIETFGSLYNQPVGIESGNSEDLSRYSELMKKIDEQKAVLYLIKLNKSFDNMEDAFNEYLLALQADFEIEMYFTDPKKYNEEKNEKITGTNPDDFITVRKIEEKALENLQNMNKSSNNPSNLIGYAMN